MFVAKRMSPNPVTVTPDTTVADASEIMRNRKSRRLPVLDRGRLVGIVTDRDLREVSPSPATTLSIFELNYLLAKMQVREIMRRNVITIGMDATIEEAALLMFNHKIGGLVVVNAAGDVVGLITETDIFKCFVDVMGLPKGKTRLTFNLADRTGMVHDVTGIFKDLGINIDSLVTYDAADGNFEMVIRADIPDVKKLCDQLAAAGYPVSHVAQIG